MADFYIITTVTANGGVKHEVLSAVNYTSSQAQALHQEKAAHGGVAQAIYREVSETLANQKIIKK